MSVPHLFPPGEPDCIICAAFGPVDGTEGCDCTPEERALAEHVMTVSADIERACCAQAAERAVLPDHYQWGHDAMEQFDFGKERAAAAIRARKRP